MDVCMCRRGTGRIDDTDRLTATSIRNRGSGPHAGPISAPFVDGFRTAQDDVSVCRRGGRSPAGSDRRSEAWESTGACKSV